MLIDRNRIREGMTVYSADGGKLGKVLTCGASTFIIEKGFFFPKDYVARYDEIADQTGDDIRLVATKDSFVNQEHRDTAAWNDAGEAGERSSSTTRASGEEVRMPLSEEELDVVKRDRQAGEARLHKEVVTEKKRIDVPVTHEEVRVEHLPAGESRRAGIGDSAFEEKSVSMPLHDEEVEIRKRPVVKEEVRLKKDRVTERRAGEEDVRRERIDVEGDVRNEPRRDLSDPYQSGTAPMRDDDDTDVP
jgi:uncharacterized protein (TIGR02271 family)